MSEKQLHEIRFKKGHKRSAEVVLSLPNGGRKKFNKFQKDKKAHDFPMVLCPLDAEDVLQLSKHGFDCKLAKKKAKE